MNKQVPNPSDFSATIDLEADGKQFGHFRIPHSRNEAGWGDLMIPIVSIRNGEGPCLLLIAGNHGDEVEGQISLRNVALELRPEAVSGQVVIVPALNLPAVLNNSRLSPLDQMNMNRIFPGNRRGTISEKIASFVYDELVHRADYVVDLHAGGRNLSALPFTMMHRYANDATSKATLALMKALSLPAALVFETEPDRDGMLDTAVEDLDKPFVAAELGGCGAVTPRSIEITMRGVRNVLIHCGLIEGEISLSEEPTQVMGIPSNGFVVATDHGLFEPFVDLGEMVEPGQVVGRVHTIHHPDRAPIIHCVEAGGMVIVRRMTGLTTHGDYVLAVAVPANPDF